MSFFIVDGTGTDVLAKVTSDNKLLVKSDSVPHEGIMAVEGRAFIIHGECHTAAAASGGFLNITNNDPNYTCRITRIYIDSHTLTPTDLIVTQVFNATIANGTDVSSTAIIQKNRTTGADFNLTVTMSDSSSDMTYTGGTQYHSFPVQTMSQYQRNMQLTNILGSGNSITFGWKRRSGGNATDGEIVSFSVNVVKEPV